MRKTYHYPTLLVLATLFLCSGCTDSGEEFDQNSLYSSWERVIHQEDHELNYVATLEFKRDGTYERSTKFRDPVTDSVVGYIQFEEGTISLNGENIDFTPTRNLFIGHEVFWGPFEELQEWEINTASQPATSKLEYREGGSKLAIFTPCNNILSSFCVPTQVYTRVN